MQLSKEQQDKLSKVAGFGKKHPLDEKPTGQLIYKEPKIPSEYRITTNQALAIAQRHSDEEHHFTTTYLGVPILQDHSIRVLARKILTYNQFKQFTSVSSVGKSGAGKTTFSTNLVHELHELAEKEFNIIFSITWVGKDELIHFDEWLKAQTRTNHIFVFEDISYALDRARKDQKLKIKNAFTEIRHILGDVRIICIFHYHYSRGFDKMMRDSYYTIYTSLSKEEKGNLVHIHGGDRQNVAMLNKFMWRLKGQDELGFFTVPLDEHDDKRKYVYWTQKPFQIALTDQHGEFHFTLYASPKHHVQVSCKLCTPFKQGKSLGARSILQIMSEKYGESNAKRIMRYYLFMRGGKNCIPMKDKRCWYFLEDIFKDFSVDMDECIKYVGENFNNPILRKIRYKERPIVQKKLEKQILKADKFYYTHTNAITKAMSNMFNIVE